MIADGWSSNACCNSLSASQSSRPDGLARLLSLRQRRVRVSSTSKGGLVGRLNCQPWKRSNTPISSSWVWLFNAWHCPTSGLQPCGSLPQAWHSR
ncbi:hypothetical protein D3C81_2034500 [compost metagenome]